MSRAQLTSTVEQNTGGAVAPYVGYKNLVANGSFDIWQRGTTFSNSVTVQYTADRWLNWVTSAVAHTISRQATGDTTNLPNIQYCTRLQRNSGQTSTGIPVIEYAAETVDSIRFAGQTFTLSFYARAGANFSASSNVMNVVVATGTGTDQQLRTFTGYTAPVNSGATLTSTWKRFTFTGNAASNITQIGCQFYFTPTGTAGTNDYYEITGVQLEVGSVATPFSRAGGTLQGELALCQRYYFRVSPTYVYSRMPAIGFGSSSTQVNLLCNYPVTMRTNPSSIDYSTLAVYDQSAITGLTNLVITATSSTTQSIELTGTAASGLTQFRPYELIANNSTSAYFGLSAEL
jgi:hypothetical protein